jgi:hypothetical protein
VFRISLLPPAFGERKISNKIAARWKIPPTDLPYIYRRCDGPSAWQPAGRLIPCGWPNRKAATCNYMKPDTTEKSRCSPSLQSRGQGPGSDRRFGRSPETKGGPISAVKHPCNPTGFPGFPAISSMISASCDATHYVPTASATNLKQLETNLKHFYSRNPFPINNFQRPVFPNLKYSRNSRSQCHTPPARRKQEWR